MGALYDAIGGAPAVDAAVDRFYERVGADPSLAHYFAGVDLPRLKAHQRSFLTAALGGTSPYRGRPMAEAHHRLGITRSAYDRVVDHLVATLAELGVDEATRSLIAAQLAPLRRAVMAV